MSRFGPNLWMRSVGVALQILGGGELGLAGTAAIRPLPCVDAHVLFQVTGLGEPSVTLVAAVGLDAQVALNVDVQAGLRGELAGTALTLVQLQLEVSPHVLPHVAGGGELGWAESAGVRPLAGVRPHVKLERLRVHKPGIALLAGVVLQPQVSTGVHQPAGLGRKFGRAVVALEPLDARVDGHVAVEYGRPSEPRAADLALVRPVARV